MLAQAPQAARAVEGHLEAGDAKAGARMRAARQQAAAGAIMKRKILRIAQVHPGKKILVSCIIKSDISLPEFLPDLATKVTTQFGLTSNIKAFE